MLIQKKDEVLSQVPSICRRIREEADKMFMPDVVDAFNNLASKEYFWLDIMSPSLQTGFSQTFKQATIGLTSEDMVSFSRLFSRIIDFKSSFTATHSSGVSAVAVRLSRLLGFTEADCRLMQIAGYLHDLGKLAVPSEILEKPLPGFRIMSLTSSGIIPIIPIASSKQFLNSRSSINGPRFTMNALTAPVILFT